MSLTRALAAIVSRPVDGATRARAALHVVDWLGCAHAGAVEPAGLLLRADAGVEGDGPATVIAGKRRGEAAAAFANGGLGNVLEMDDVHKQAILHPGPVTIAAALATAEAEGASGAQFLDAVVAGYEAVIRVGRSLGPAHYAKWHNTASAGPFGAAAACGRLLGLDDEAMVSALGNAGTQVSGPWQCRHEPVMTKQLHTARAAHAGLKAARLAALGFTGPAYILEGPQGLYAATAPDCVPERVTADPDGPFLITQTSIKPWPACRHAHAAIDAALLVRPRVDAPVAAITIRTYDDALAFCDRPTPDTVIGAKFSLQHAVAATLVDGPPPLSQFSLEAIGRSDIAHLRSLCHVERDEAFASAYPARYGTGLTVALKDGRVLTADVPDALGDPENPLPEAMLLEKAHALLRHAGVDQGAAEDLVDAALALTDSPHLTALSAALQKAGQSIAERPTAGVPNAA
ncbi:MAG: MmgE/PrpD family protein [Pseudomonadota bacterium]